MNYHAFNEARANFEAQRKEQAAIAAQALEMKLLQRDFIKVTSDLKIALERIEAERAAAPPAKPASKTTAPKAAVPAPKAITKSPTAKTASKTITKPRRTLAEVEASLATLSQRITALSKRLTP